MKNTRSLPLTLLAVLLCLPFVAGAGESVVVEGAWSRSTPPGMKMGGVYFQIRNQGDAPDRLLGVKSNVSASATLHETVMQGGMARMRPMGPLDLPPGASVAFAPRGRHVMLMGLNGPLVEGERFEITLHLERAGIIAVPVEIRSMTGMGTMGGM